MDREQLYKRHVARAKVLHAQGRISQDALGAIMSGRGLLREHMREISMFDTRKTYRVYFETVKPKESR